MSLQRVKLTELFIDQLELRPAIYRDSELIGFAVRVNNNYKTYIVEKKVLGKSVRSTLGVYQNITLDQAREIAKEKLFQMSMGINPNKGKQEKSINLEQKKPIVKEAFDHYLKSKVLKQRTIDDYTVVINKYLVDWHFLKIDEISKEMILLKYIELSKNSKAQASMAMRVFRAVYNFSVKNYIDSDNQPILSLYNPVKALGANKVWNNLNTSSIYYDQNQLENLVQAIFQYQEKGKFQETNRDYLLTLLLTGLYKDECESLNWNHVDLNLGIISIKNSKNGIIRTIVMGDFLYELMKKRKKNIESKWVFPSEKSKMGHLVNISKARKRINKMSNTEFTFYDLRKIYKLIVYNLDYNHYIIKILISRNFQKNDIHLSGSSEEVSDARLRIAMNEIENIILKDYKHKFLHQLK